MNYVHHAIIGVGTASLGVLAAESLGAAPTPVLSLGMGALVVAIGSIATDLDHPRSFISNTIPSRLLRIALAVLAIPILAALGTFLTTRDLGGTLNGFTSLVMGIRFLRWTAIALAASLGLMVLSLILYKSLHHRGPLHSLIFTAGITLLLAFACGLSGVSPAWGLVFGWGWLWHILADGLTDHGVPFFWPFNDERKHTLPRWACPAGRLILSTVSVVSFFGLIIFRLQPYLV